MNYLTAEQAAEGPRKRGRREILNAQRWHPQEAAGIEAPETGGVYVLGAREDLFVRVALVKIGRAKNIRARMAELQCGSPATLFLLTVLSENPEDEPSFHFRFRELRHRGEWFRLEGELYELVHRLWGPK